jgi:hypothetical protein
MLLLLSSKKEIAVVSRRSVSLSNAVSPGPMSGGITRIVYTMQNGFAAPAKKKEDAECILFEILFIGIVRR